jgi:PAS domain S-box-containing protein
MSPASPAGPPENFSPKVSKLQDVRRNLLRYLSVIASVAVAALLRLPLHPVLGSRVAFITLFPAIVYSAWVAGFGGGLLATALSAAVAAWFFIPLHDALRIADPADQFSLVVFVLVGVAVSGMGEAQRQAQRRAEEGAEAAERSAAILRESEARTTGILETIGDGFHAVDRDWRITSINPQAERIVSRTRAEVIGKVLWEAFPEAVGSTFEQQYRRALAENIAVTFEEYYPPLSAWLEVRAFPAPEGLSIYFRDITERKAAEGTLQTSEARFRQMADAIPHIAWTTRPDGSVEYYNQRWFDFSGLTLEQTKDWGWEAVIHPDDLAHAGGVWREAIQGEAVSEVEYRLRRVDGEYRWHLGRSVPVREDGQIIRWVGTATDIEDRRRAEDTRMEGERHFRALADNIAQLAWMADAEGLLFWYNQRWFDYTGTTLEQMQGWGWQAVHDTDHVERVSEKFRLHVREGREWEDTFPLRGKDGRFRWFLSRAFPIRDDAGQVTFWCGTNTDVTELRETEAKLATAYRREVMLNQIGQAIRATRDPNQIQAAAVRALGETLGADRAYFNLLDTAQDRSWIGQDFRRADLPSLAGEYRISDYQIEPAAFYPGGATLVLPDAQTWDWPAPLAEAIRSLRVRAAINVPLYDHDLLVGTLAVAMADEPRVWTDEEVSLVETVAVQTRAALDAARLQEREHRIAEQLQDALQPALPKQVPGLSFGKFTQPALEEAAVGGDFYDVFPLDKNSYALVIGDVSGKGLAAAQQLALIRNSLRTTLYLYRAPAQAAAGLNSIVTAHDLLIGFVTVWIGIYNAVTGEIVYCSCGHEPGLVRRTGGQVEEMETTGPPLGVAENAAYGEESFILSSGDALLLYTDGVSESGPSRREMLGTEGLRRLFGALPTDLEAQAESEALVERVSAHTNGVFRDDVAMLLMRRG